MDRWPQIVTFIALWLLVMLLAGSQTPILTFLAPRVAVAAPEVWARGGYFGQVPSSGWIPVEVVVRNRDATAFRGHVEVRQLAGSGAGGPPGRVGPTPPPGTVGSGGVSGLGKAVSARWRIPVEVPAGEDRHVIPWIWWDTGAQYEVHLVDGSGSSVASAPLQHRTAPPETTWVAVIGERSIPYLRTLPGVRGGSVIALEPYSHVLPRSSSGWFSFDVVIIDGAAALDQLEPDQLEALRLWVKMGGALVLGTGGDAAAMAQVLGPELFPWTVRDTVEISDYGEAVALARRLDPEAPALGRGAPPSVAAILAERQADRETGETEEAGDTRETGDTAETAPGAASGARHAASPTPLTYRADAGLGRVYAWATRLDAEPWLSWRGMQEAIAAWLGADLAPGVVRRADAFAGGWGMGPGGPGVAGTVQPISFPMPIEAGGPRALAFALFRGPSPMGGPPVHAHHLLQRAARDMHGLQLPAPGVMLAGVGAYLALIGPVTFGWLRRRRRREWAWIAVPAIALASITVAYVAGTATGAVGSRNATGYLFVTPDGDSGVWSGHAGTYRPTGTAEMERRREALVGPLGISFGFGPPFDDTGSGLTVEPALVGQRVSWPDPAPGRIPAARIQADITLGGRVEARWQPASARGDECKVEVANGLGLTLKNPVIVQGGQVLSQLPDLAPGQRHEDRVRLQAPQPVHGPMAPWSPLFSRPGAPRGADWRSRQEARLQQALAETSQGMASGALLVALVEGTPVFSPDDGDTAGAAGHGGAGDKSPATHWDPNGVTLLIQPLSLALPEAGEAKPAFRLTNAIVPLETREARAAGAESQGPGMPVHITDGVLEMEWRPPAALVRRASALVIDVPAGIGIDLYDHAEARWLTVRAPGENDLPAGAPAWARRDVQVAGARVRITGAALNRFFGPDGRLPLKLNVEGRATLPTPVLTLEGGGEVRER